MSFIALDVCGGRFGPLRKVFAASWEWFSMPCLVTPAACRLPFSDNAAAERWVSSCKGIRMRMPNSTPRPVRRGFPAIVHVDLMGNFITSPLIQGGRTDSVAGARLGVAPTNCRTVMRDLRASRAPPGLNTAALGRAFWHAGRNFRCRHRRGCYAASRLSPKAEHYDFLIL